MYNICAPALVRWLRTPTITPNTPSSKSSFFTFWREKGRNSSTLCVPLWILRLRCAASTHGTVGSTTPSTAVVMQLSTLIHTISFRG